MSTFTDYNLFESLKGHAKVYDNLIMTCRIHIFRAFVSVGCAKHLGPTMGCPVPTGFGTWFGKAACVWRCVAVHHAGPLYCIYAAHLILMKKYNEIGAMLHQKSTGSSTS
eukprot:4341579-Amphidinium_carterae.1